MRRFILSLALCSVLMVPACDDDPANPGNGGDADTLTWQTLIIRDIDFVKDQYFYFKDPDQEGGIVIDQISGTVTDHYLPDLTEDILVFRELKGAEIADPTINPVPCRAWVDTTGTGQRINERLAPLMASTFPNGEGSAAGWFELLELGIDYAFVVDVADRATVIGLELAQPIPKTEQRVLAVSFTNRDGDPVGGQRYNDLLPPGSQLPADRDTLALCMIKPRRKLPYGEFEGAWDYMMRSIYDLSATDLASAVMIEVSIEDNLAPREDATTPVGSDMPYLRIFGLDIYDAATNDRGFDGMVDDWLLDYQLGRLVLRGLTPFAPDPVHVDDWTLGGFAFEGAYLAQWQVAREVYRTDPSLLNFQSLHQYDIVVRAAFPKTD